MFSLNLHSRSLWSTKPHYLINLLSDSPVNTSIITWISHYHTYKYWPSCLCLGRLLLRSTDLNCGRAVHSTFNLDGFNSIHNMHSKWPYCSKGLLSLSPCSPKKSTYKIMLEGTTPVLTCGTAAIRSEQTWTSQFVWTTLNLYEWHRGATVVTAFGTVKVYSGFQMKNTISWQTLCHQKNLQLSSFTCAKLFLDFLVFQKTFFNLSGVLPVCWTEPNMKNPSILTVVTHLFRIINVLG